MNRWVRSAPPLLLAGMLLAGCGVGDKGGEGAMNMQEAAEHSDAMLDATLAAIKPDVQWAHDQNSSGSCDVTRRRAVLTIISEERRGSFLGMVERFWKRSGYKIISVNPSKEYPAIFARTPKGFGINVEIADKGQAHFEVSTPCVKESDVAAPTAAPNGPAYEGVEIPRPNVRSDFWSVGTPVPASTPRAG